MRPEQAGRTRRTLALLTIIFAAGCTTPYSSSPSTGDKARQAMSQPFADLNLFHTDIPHALLIAGQTPFSPPASLYCGVLANEIATLTTHLGPVLSAFGAKSSANSSTTDDAVWGAVRSASGGIIPFRGVVRWMSGAEQRDRDLARAVLAGFVRRAYLEGIRDERRCPPNPG